MLIRIDFEFFARPSSGVCGRLLILLMLPISPVALATSKPSTNTLLTGLSTITHAKKEQSAAYSLRFELRATPRLCTFYRKASRPPHVPSRATPAYVGGVEVVKKWLKRVYVTVSMSEVKENQSGWVQKTLEGLLECESLEEVTIALMSNSQRDRGLMQQVLAKEVRPVATQLPGRVRDECIQARHVDSWWTGGGIAAW
jgi:hypothetical protein